MNLRIETTEQSLKGKLFEIEHGMKLITTNDAAERLGVTVQRIHALIRDGRLPAERLGRDYVIKEEDLALVADRRPGRPTQFGIFSPDYQKVSSAPGWDALTKEKQEARLLAEVKKRNAELNDPRAIPEGMELNYMRRIIDSFEARPARKVEAKKPAAKKAKKGAAK